MLHSLHHGLRSKAVQEPHLTVTRASVNSDLKPEEWDVLAALLREDSEPVPSKSGAWKEMHRPWDCSLGPLAELSGHCLVDRP